MIIICKVMKAVDKVKEEVLVTKYHNTTSVGHLRKGVLRVGNRALVSAEGSRWL